MRVRSSLSAPFLNSWTCSDSNAAMDFFTLVNSPAASSMTSIIKSKEHLFSTPIHFLQKSGFILPIVGTLWMRKPQGIRLAR
ncbi:hypothetical protein XELAEV_18017161mg [Xenopus laevis]|uniref:Uncharacterized protein n=1 Tax=Xenopus laevis TaxID=8355 RepID=A0A974HS65_XENLA|nr:hypothetical protein XELAEV_18017161mg [Xenopus laevis]